MTHNSIAYYAARVQEGANLEQARSNRVREAISDFEAKSNDRFRQSTVFINELQAREAARHNAASEALQSRLNEIQNQHNVRLAEIQSRQADIQARSVEYQRRYQEGIIKGNEAKLQEESRHNVETEATAQANIQLGNVKNFWTGISTVTQIPGIVLGSALAFKKLRGQS